MEITFEKVGNKYVAEFEASADFNIHIERVKEGTLEMFQTTVKDGQYDFFYSPGIKVRKIMDLDVVGAIYPKWIKVVSGSEVLSTSVNFNEGGGLGSGSDKKYFTFYNWRGYPYNGDDETLSNQIAFTFQFEEGMTWEDWINSKYNVLGMSFYEDSYTDGRVFLYIAGENGNLPIGVITIAYNPQDEYNSPAMHTDLIRENNNFVYSGTPTAF